MIQDVGRVDPVCPYCNAVLERMPFRKKACPACGQPIYVRTRPADRQKILVTESELAEVEAQWEAANAYSDFTNENPGLTPDQLWGKCNAELLQHGQAGDWGLYRNTRMHMAEMLAFEGRLENALQTYLEVLYLDANGPRNLEGLRGDGSLGGYAPFSPKEAIVAPGMVSRAQSLRRRLGLDERALEHRFIEGAQRVHDSMRLPLSPRDAWNQVRSHPGWTSA